MRRIPLTPVAVCDSAARDRALRRRRRLDCAQRHRAEPVAGRGRRRERTVTCSVPICSAATFSDLSIAGTRSAVIGPVFIALGSMLLGMVLGTVSGYTGGWIDLLLTKYADLLLALPVTLIALVVAGLIDGGYWVTVLVLVVLFSPTDIRLMRSAVMTQATRPYIESARVLGLSRWRIMFRHILPNVLPIAFATMLLNVAFALVAMSALSFLGLGVGPGEPDWGRQLSDGRDLLSQNAAAVIVPGVLIIIAAATINLLGDWIQERFNAEAGVR